MQSLFAEQRFAAFDFTEGEGQHKELFATRSRLCGDVYVLRRRLMPLSAVMLHHAVDKGIEAYRKGDVGYFQIPDSDERTLGGKFVAHMLWYGHSRVLFTADFVQDLLVRAGFSRVVQCEYRQTSSGIPDLVQLDGRAAESLFVEAVK